MRSLRRKRLRRRHRDSRRARLPVDEVVLRVLGNGVEIGEMNAVQAVDTAVAEIDVDVGGRRERRARSSSRRRSRSQRRHSLSRFSRSELVEALARAMQRRRRRG